MGDVVYLTHYTRHVNQATPWRDDYNARAHVAVNPDGMTLADIGATMGVTKQRVEQIERDALRKLLLHCVNHGDVTLADVRDMLACADSRVRATVPSGPDGDAGGRQIYQRYEPMPVEGACAYSEHGRRVEAALAALEATAERALDRAAELEMRAALLLGEAESC